MKLSPAARNLEQVFLASGQVFPECSDQIHVRWEKLVQRLPGLAGRSLSDDFGDIFRPIEKSGEKAAINNARNLACLQNHYFSVLLTAGLIPTHVHQTQIVYGLYWQQRLWDREQKMSNTRRMDYRLRKAEAVPYKAPTWVN